MQETRVSRVTTLIDTYMYPLYSPVTGGIRFGYCFHQKNLLGALQSLPCIELTPFFDSLKQQQKSTLLFIGYRVLF